MLEQMDEPPLSVPHGPYAADVAADLAALYLEQAISTGRAQDLFRSLSASLKALAIEPGHRGALFNEALVLEQLSLTGEARAIWSTYLSIAEGSDDRGWIEEALSHQRQLSDAGTMTLRPLISARLDMAALAHDRGTLAALVRKYPQAARLHVEDDLLTSWAEAASRGAEREAARTLAVAREIAVVEYRLDPMPAESVIAIENVSTTDVVRHARLLRGYLRYRTALSAYERFAPEAKALFSSAAADLDAGGSAFSLWARFYLALNDYHANAYDTALSRLAAIRQAAGRYPNLDGRMRLLEGLIASIQGDPMRSLDAYRAAVNCFKRSEELGNEAAVHHQMAEVLFRLGQEEEAWKELGCGLRGLPSILESRLRQGVLQAAALVALRDDEPNVALVFEDAALHAARGSHTAVRVALALRERAAILHRLRRVTEAIADLREAEGLARLVGDPALSADVLLSRAKVLRENDPHAALEALVRVWPLLERTGYVTEFAPFYLERAQLRVTLGEAGLAEADFVAGIAAIEAQRHSLSSDLRATYLDQYRALFDGVIELSFATSRDSHAAGAFRYLEQGRARSLLDLSVPEEWANGASGEGPTLSLTEAEELLPNGVTVLELALLEKRLLIWVIRKGSATVTTVPLSASRVEEMVTHLQREARAGGDARELEQLTGQLSELLLRPLGTFAPAGDKLIVIPDKALGQVPFAALKDPRTGRYLIAEHPLAIAPSCSFYLRRVDHPRADPRAPFSILAIGDPAVDGARNPGLPLAGLEAREVAALYQHAGSPTCLLTGGEATRDRFLSSLGAFEVVHFAGHAEVDESDPIFSRLLLAATPSDSGIVFASDLYKLHFGRTQLVVLAGCNTASGSVSPSEGVLSLGRPFLAGGVRSVVASLWPVTDQSALAFSSRFHQAFLASQDAAVALRTAQLAMMTDPNPEIRSPAAWGAFVLLGEAGLPDKQQRERRINVSRATDLHVGPSSIRSPKHGPLGSVARRPEWRHLERTTTHSPPAPYRTLSDRAFRHGRHRGRQRLVCNRGTS